MLRRVVYDLIDGERDYQDSLFGQTASSDRSGDGTRSLDEYCLYIYGLAADLANFGSHHTSKDTKLELVRKIAALTVHCMEDHGGLPR